MSNNVYVLICGGDDRKENRYSMIGVFASKAGAETRMMAHAADMLRSHPTLRLQTLPYNKFYNISFTDHETSFWGNRKYTKSEYIYRFVEDKEDESDDEEEDNKTIIRSAVFYVIIPTQILE